LRFLNQAATREAKHSTYLRTRKTLALRTQEQFFLSHYLAAIYAFGLAPPWLWSET
jgi:hypothetical protein